MSSINRVGGIYIENKTICITKDTKFYLNEFGFFYEGQTLEKYVIEKGSLKFDEYVFIKKFIVHYNKKTKEPNLYFRFGNFYNKNEYTINCNQLGILYKKRRIIK